MKDNTPQFDQHYVDPEFKKGNLFKFYFPSKNPFKFIFQLFKLCWGYIIGRLISPSFGWSDDKDGFNKITTKSGFTGHYYGMFFKDNENVQVQDRKVVVHFGGNAQSLKSTSSYMNIFNSHNKFDHFFVGHSRQPGNKESSIEVGEAVLKMLISKGYKPENITLEGNSLGGAVAIEAAAKFKNNGVFKNGEKFEAIISHKSLGEMAKVVNQLFGLNEKFSRFLLNFSGWNYTPAQKIIDGIPVKNIHVINSNSDSIIRGTSSLSACLENQKLPNYQSFTKDLDDTDHNYYRDDLVNAKLDSFIEKKEPVKTGKMNSVYNTCKSFFRSFVSGKQASSSVEL